MLNLELRFEDGTTHVKQLSPPVEIGRAPQANLRLGTWRVARRHARIDQRESGLFLEDFGSLTGTLVNGQRVTQYGPLQPGDEIIVGPCLIHLRDIAEPKASGHAADPPIQVAANDSTGSLPTLQALVPSGAPTIVSPRPDTENVQISVAALLHHRRRLHAALLEALDLRRRDVANMSDTALRGEATAVLAEIIQSDPDIPASVNRDDLLIDVVNEAVGLGPLEPLLADPHISEIMVNRHDEIFIESAGRLVRHFSGFSSEQAVLGVIDRIVSPLGRRIDESSPMVDARLRDGSRVNAIIPPLALRGASLTIRKFPKNRPSMDDLIRVGALDASMCEFLRLCVGSRKNIIVSGGTGSGKTTLLNVLSNCISASERIVTIEDAAELRLDHEHLVSLEARPANLEGRGKVDIRDLVRNALRMRPDRIVIGECRGSEAFDMLAAMNTGHEGSLTTLHANSPRDALSRLETMILMAGMDLPLAAVREHIAASIDLLVQQARLSDGRRLITSIVEVTGTESGRIQTQELFRYQAAPVRAFIGCGVMPEFFSNNGECPQGLDAALFHQRTELNQTVACFEITASQALP
ncbi:Flp pilus assembly complex ATPase component TadA [Paralcaligenes sp. KSB-10]|uniref:ATPase, T2SS/T4P/T4SS family n=1 Tax=Paralcaligenes sp. KSB-10 TaxID=2901142 RepID=UPI001E3994A6|nr:ATPase, T2SS/T4P/T4SS family [Paralcaligenes sp. KSB-10]UHL65000.1 Flp pilus assembly complex ATPase component TadA [Paralcaligenes sp. KSB-10]